MPFCDYTEHSKIPATDIGMKVIPTIVSKMHI